MFFYNEFSNKKFSKFFNSQFQAIENFFTAEFIAKKFEKFLQSILLKKNFENFSENPKKFFLPKRKKRDHGGGGKFAPFFFQQNPTRPFVGF